jgi:hypothetical protein
MNPGVSTVNNQDKQIISHDFEGNLIQFNVQPPQYGKELSLETAWHIDRPEDMAYSVEESIQSVKLYFKEKRLLIYYKPSVEPLNLKQLHSLLLPGTSFSDWRFAKLAIDLCESLKDLHTAEMPQLVIHPGRIGKQDNRFIILPTLACIMPPFEELKNREDTGWLHYIAPEVLRTRGNEVNRLPKSDIYSLGRTLQAFVSANWEPPVIDDPLAFIESVVESFKCEFPPEWLPDFLPFKPVISEMCALFPEDRPSLDQLSVKFKEILNQYEPESSILRLINEKQLEPASSYLKVLREGGSSGLFACPRQKFYELSAKFHLAQSPPDYAKAIGQFQNVLTLEPDNVGIHLQIAQTYLNFRSHPQHLLLSAASYEKAAILTDWQEDIMTHLLEVLSRLNHPEMILRVTARIPWDRRPPASFFLRAESCIALEEYFASWNETANYFKKYGFDIKIYGLAQKAASFIEPLELLRWKHQVKHTEDIPGVKISFSIVWERNGNMEMAKQCMEEGIGKKSNREEN